MQQKMINYKEDGMSNLKYELVDVEIKNNCKIINVKFRSDNESIPVETKQDMQQPKNSNLT